MALNQESLERLWQHIIARLGRKVDKEDGKGLSSCDFTAEEKEKLKDLETNTRADWNETDPTSASYIVNTPTEVENNIIAEWDGVITEDMVTINGFLYKVSNYNDTDPSKISGITIYLPQQGEMFLPLDEKSLIYTEQDGISALNFEDYFYVVSAPIAQFSEAGTYLMYAEQEGYVKALNGKINVVKEKNISKKIARLTDLPCGEIPGGIYWDGDTTNKESVQLEDGTFLYKVSDEFYNIEDLLGKKVGAQAQRFYQEVSLSSNDIQSINEDLLIILHNAIIIALKETILEGVGTFSPGTYFAKKINENKTTSENSFSYISYLETDSTTKILDEKYIPDTIARVEDINTAINNITHPITSVNGQTGNVEITAASLGALTSAPVSSVNGNTGDVVLTASDVGALPDTTNIPSIEGLASENYVETKIAGLVNSAPETLNTLNELATALGNDPNFATTIAAEIGTKANANDLTSHIGNKSNPHNVTAAQIGAATEEYVNNAISNIPALDVSGQISTHNTDTAAHNDIREAIANLNTLVGDTSVSTQIESAINALREEILGGAW